MRKVYRTAGVALALAFSAGCILPASAATAPNEPAWQDVESSKDIVAPRGIGVVNDQDIWTFGLDNQDKPISAHWDGKTWTTVPIPQFSELATFAARSSDDAWVGGRHFDSGSKFLAHWDGKSWKSVDPFANSGGDHESMVNDIAFVGDDVWVAGGCCGKPGWLTRFDGKEWTEVALPPGENPQDPRYPEGLVATKSGDLFAGGMNTGGTDRTALLLRGGKDGFTEQQPPETKTEDYLWRAGTLDGETLYAAGYRAISSDGNKPVKYQPVIFRWDGSKWSDEQVGTKNDCLPTSLARAGKSLYVSSDTDVIGKPCTFRLDPETSKWNQIPAPGVSSHGFNPALGIGGSPDSDTLWAYGDGGGSHLKTYRP